MMNIVHGNVIITVRQMEFFEPIYHVRDSRDMSEVDDCSVHLVVTSPPYYNAKKYSNLPDDLGNTTNPDSWRLKMRDVWKECLRVLAPGRKMFVNLMNLPVPASDKQLFHSINLVGWTIDDCVGLGFAFKREIIWEKANSVQSPIGSYPYPGALPINFMHEFILEFEKSGKRDLSHLSGEIKEASKLSKDQWVEIKKSSVWKIKPAPSGNRDHPAPFPKEIPIRIIRGFSYLTEVVMDPFLGTGTTTRVARRMGRRSIGYEVNPDFERFFNNYDVLEF